MIIIPKNKIYNSYIIESQDIQKAYDKVIDFICDIGFDRLMINEGSHPDVITIKRDDEKQSISIDKIRENIIDKVDIIPSNADRKIFIIKVDTFLSKDIQNTLLKTLEEPPSYVSIFILIKNKDNLLDTVRSRCFYIRDDENVSALDEIKNEEYIESILKVVPNLKFIDSYDIIDLSKTLSYIKSNDEFKKMLLYILYLTRDALYYKNTYDKKNIILKEREVEVTFMAETYTYEALGKLTDLLEENMSLIDSNIDKQLLIEDMLFKIYRIM